MAWYDNRFQVYDPTNDWLWDTLRLVNYDDYGNPWSSGSYDPRSRSYTPTSHGSYGVRGSHYNYTMGIEGKPEYKEFTNALLDSNGNFTDVGKQWAKLVDYQISGTENNSLATFYDPSGNLRQSWEVNTNNVHGRPRLVFNRLGDYVNYIRNDLVLGPRHNGFLKTGQRYYYTDSEGKRHYVSPEEARKYKIIKTETTKEGLTNWTDNEITDALAGPNNNDQNPNGSMGVGNGSGGSIGIGNGDENTQPLSERFGAISATLKKNLPNLLEGLRLASGLYYNNKIYKEKLKGIRPTLYDSYHTYRNIVGDEATKLAYYRRGVQGLTKAGLPITSDLDRQLAYMMEAKRAADELRAQGDLADNAEIRRTSDESNQHQWANILRDTDIGNLNRASINNANAAILDLKALKYAATQSTINNYLLGIEYRQRENLERKKALDYQIRALQGLTDLEFDERILAANKKLRAAIDKATTEGGITNWDDENILNAQKELKKAKNLVLIEYYQNLGNAGYYKKGAKVTYSTSQDLLYKSARDTVEHFRKMSKMSDDSTYRTRAKAPKLTPYPKKKLQLGGVAPFSVFTPVALSRSRGSSSYYDWDNLGLFGKSGKKKSSEDKEDESKEKALLNFTKDLFNKLDGLPGDVKVVANNLLNFLKEAEVFGRELSTSDIATRYMLYVGQVASIKHSKEVYTKARDLAINNDALGEFAVTSDGKYIVLDEEGKLSFATLENIKKNNLNPITNEQLLNLRAYSPSMLLGKGDSFMELIVNNGIGMTKIASQISALKGTLGTSEEVLEGYTKHESNLIRKGFELLAEAPTGDYSYKDHTKEQLQQMGYALNYIKGMLPKNMEAVLKINALQRGTTMDNLISSLLKAGSTTYNSREYQAVTGKAAKSEGNGDGGDTEGKLTPSMAFFMGMGDRNTFTILDKTKYGLKVETNSMSLLDSSGHNLGPSTLLGISLSMYGSQLDLNSATMGDVKISPNGQTNVLINDGMIYATELPIDKLAALYGIIKPDLTFLKNIEKADQELRKLGITNRDNLTSDQIDTINKVYKNNNLPIIYTKDGNGNPVLTNEYRRFAMLNGMATEDAFEGDMTFNDGAIEIDDDKEAKRFEQTMLAVTNNPKYKLKRGWIGGTDLYKGVIYIPMNSSTITALGGTGYKGKASDYMEIDRLQQLRDNALKLGYNPGGNASMLK